MDGRRDVSRLHIHIATETVGTQARWASPAHELDQGAMSVLLEIPDGSPWWLSPDIWTVPGSNPEAAPGMPVAGEQCYLWAHVLNNGTEPVANATVRFFWANPAVGFDRNTATHIGDASVSLQPMEGQDVLCLVPWVPSFLNNGHECVLAEAFHPTLDPLPPGPAFEVPTDRHVAQRNLSVIKLAAGMARFAISFEIHNTARVSRTFALRAKAGATDQLRPLKARLGRAISLKGTGSAKHAGFIAGAQPCAGDEEVNKATESIVVAPGGRGALTLTGELSGDAAMVHVVQEADGAEVGGLSVLVTRAKAANKRARA